MTDHNTASFTWRGLYVLKESARKEIIEQYSGLQDYGKIMKIQFDPMRNSFTVIGPKERSEDAQQTFVNLINNYIDKLYTKNLGVHQYISRGKVARPVSTQMFIRELQWTDNLDELKKIGQDDFDDIFEEIDRGVPGAEAEKYKWTPQHKETFRECFFPEGTDLIEEISRSVGCIMKIDWVTRDVNIRAANKATVAAGVKRLNTAEEYHHWNYQRLSAHLINNDGRERFELLLVLITKQKSTILKTTLFPPISQWSSLNGRDKLASARLAEYKPESDKYENVTFNCNPTYNAGQPKTEIWNGYTYTPRFVRIEEPIVQPSKPPPPPPPPTAAAAVTSGSRGAISLGSRPSNNIATAPAPAPATSSAITRDQTTGALAFGARPQDILIDLEEEGENLPTMAPKRKVRNARTTETSFPKTASTFTYASENSSASPAPSVKPTTPNDLPQDATNVFGRPRPRSESGSSSSTPRPGPSSARRPRQKNGKAKNHARQESEDGNQGGAVSEASQGSEKYFNTNGHASVSSGGRTVRPKPEYQTRTFKNTQNQQAPHKSRFDDLSTIRLHQKAVFEKVFDAAFEDVRRFCGDVRFEARLGRIVFPMIPKKFLKSTYAFQWSNWDNDLHRAKIQTLFTDILSISPSDADFVVGLKVSGGDPLFEKPPIVRNVIYEIEGLTFQKFPFTIVINAETFEFEVRSDEQTFGTVFWNCPTMTWDAEFRLVGYKNLKSLEAQAKKIVESLDVEYDLDYPIFTINTQGLDLEIRSGSCRRESRHMVLPSEVHHGHEFTLVLTEHIGMKLQDRDDLPGILRFQSVYGTESNHQNMTWYTMHLVSDEVEQAFWKNRALKITELTDKSAKDILLKKERDGLTTMEAMVAAVSNLVSKINNVGYSNLQYTLHTA
ncbi:hypothetical protein ABW20_dc0103787 [Dactylellina cionopaga]|nr:hypothetical protein ABW20_dc0103787 [Dactylellina cionopaga]